MAIHNYKFTPPKGGWPEFDEEGNIINETDDEVGEEGQETPQEETRDESKREERISSGKNNQ